MAIRDVPLRTDVFEARQRAFVDHAQREALSEAPHMKGDVAKAAAASFAHQLKNNPDFLAIFDVALELNDAPEVIAAKAMKGVQTIAMKDVDALLGCTEQRQWDALHNFIAINPDLSDRLTLYSMLPVASCVDERGVILNGVSRLFNYDLQKKPLSLLEPGSSLGNNSKRLLLQGKNPLLKYGFVKPVVRTDDGSGYRVDKASRANIDRLMRGDFTRFGRLVCYDILDMDDPTLQGWAVSNSWYYSELTDARRRQRFDYLLATQPDNVSHYVGDVTIDMKADLEAKLDEKADVSYASYLLWQLGDQGKTALDNIEACTDGMVVVHDFIKDYDRQSGQFSFNHHRKRWSSSVWVKHMSQPQLGYQKVATVDAGRPKAVIFEQAAYDAPGAARFGLA